MTMTIKNRILRLLAYRDNRTPWQGWEPADIAALLECLEDGARLAALFRTLPKDLAADVFFRLSGPAQAGLVRAFAAGDGPVPDRKPYFAASAWEHARRRLLWLLALMLSAAVTGAVITRYESAVSAVPLLVAFLPMLMDTGGNCGSQSATLVIRGLALEEIRPRDLFRVVRKELAVSLIVSAVLAAANGLRILLQYRDGAIALVISLSLAATVVLAKLVGCVLPIAAKRLRMDPAIMASPLITTIVDAGAVLIYFRTAAALLHLPV